MPIEVVADAIPDNRQPIATSAHTIGLVLINLGIAAWGIVAQMRSTGGSGLAAGHSGVVPLYSSLIVMEWALLYYVWAGSRKNVTFWGLVGGKWRSLRDVLTDFGIALPFWVIWETVAWLVTLGPGTERSEDS